MSDARLRFAPEILARLGEELNPHPDQGVLELVKNAYDADARTCRVTLSDTLELGGSVVISDDGDGMTSGEIAEGWLLLGKSSKQPERRTRLRRLQVGEKGLGRLAALRLGRTATLRTRPREEPGVEYRLELDWARFDSAEAVEDVPLELDRREVKDKPGTDILIQELQVRLTRRDVKRLARSLVLLADPFQATTGFHAVLEADGFSDLEELVSRSYFDHTWYEIHARVDGAGRPQLEAIDHVTGAEYRAGPKEMSDRLGRECSYEAPPASFDLWVFNLLGPLPGGGTAATLGGLREWMREVGGVHVYHRGLRVQPYGDPGYDWLDMNLRRSRSPEERPSTNNSVGRVLVEDPHAQLIQKTDRSGFIEDENFHELRRFGQDVLDWVASRRLEDAEERRRRAKTRTPRTREAALRSLRETVEHLPARERKRVEPKLRALERASDKEVEALMSDVELYRTLSTLGTTTALVAHEAFNPSITILKMADSIERRGMAELDGRFESTLGRPLGVLRKAAERLHVYSQLPRRLLNRDKRKPRLYDVYSAIREVIDVYTPILEEHRVSVELELAELVEPPRISGPVAAFEAIVGNLLLNAVNALDRKKGRAARRILLRADARDGLFTLEVLDNADGITGISLSEIWLPGRSTTDGGTGLGLTIVRDAVLDLGGKIDATAKGELGGASFELELPVQH